MKEKIYTIPVNDAYRSDAACPLCKLRADVERGTLDFYLGASLMEPDTRVATNKLGFCRDHLNKMYGREINRLGIGLMLHTHMKQLRDDFRDPIRKAAPDKRTLLKGRDGDFGKRISELASALEKRSADCIVCDKIRFTMERYSDVLLWMYFEDEEFREAFRAKKGHCVEHVAFLLRGAVNHLNQNKCSEFAGELLSMHREAFDKLIDDVEWFTLKFDYRNKDKPWGDSKDAIPRAMNMLTGEESRGNDT
ncbi:MAG: ABC transporter substrate-binding protein [Clostridiaceae bacterium]|nr:ABC transporter substrate-binding protein [Clostridiaceae bacterium]